MRYADFGIPETILIPAPLKGQEVILNPEGRKYSEYQFLQGKIGFIFDPKGQDSDVKYVIEKMKRGSTEKTWNVIVRFLDTSEGVFDLSCRLGDLLTIESNGVDMEEIKFRDTPMRRVVNGISQRGETVEEIYDRFCIEKGRKIFSHVKHDAEWRKKMMENA